MLWYLEEAYTTYKTERLLKSKRYKFVKRVYSTEVKTAGAVNRLFAAVFGWSVVGRARGS
jgi:hypothetical protein